MVHLGQLKHVWLGHSHIVVNEKFHDGTARNNAFRPGLPLWRQIAHSQLVLGWGCKTLHINSCIVSIVFMEVLPESRYIGHDFDT